MEEDLPKSLLGSDEGWYKQDQEPMVELLPRTTSDSSSDDDDDIVELYLDEALKKAGEFGWYQKFLIFIQCLSHTVGVYHILGIAFIGLSPVWVCSEESINFTNETSTNDTEDTKCSLYEERDSNCTPVYEDRFYSLTQEWSLLCDESYKINLTQSGFFLGFLIGSFVIGSLADRIGRRKVIFGYLTALAIVHFLTAFSLNYYIFAIFRFILGFFLAGGLTFYVLVCEVIGPNQRSMLAVLSSVFFGAGFGILSLTAYLIRQWRALVTLSGILSLLLLALCFKCTPESPRWLLVNGREVEAKKTLITIAKRNGRSLPADFTLKMPENNKPSSVMIVSLLKHRVIRNRMLILMLAWFTNTLVYYGLSLGVGSFTSYLYLAFTLSGFVEIPSILLSWITLQKIGRKWSNFGFLLFAGIFSLACSIVQFIGINPGGKLQLVLSLIGKFSIAASFAVIYAYTPELLPTDVRNLGVGVSNVAARVGGLIAPLVILLDSHVTGLSMLIMGTFGVITSIVCLYLPETRRALFPDTLAEVKK